MVSVGSKSRKKLMSRSGGVPIKSIGIPLKILTPWGLTQQKEIMH